MMALGYKGPELQPFAVVAPASPYSMVPLVEVAGIEMIMASVDIYFFN